MSAKRFSPLSCRFPPSLLPLWTGGAPVPPVTATVLSLPSLAPAARARPGGRTSQGARDYGKHWRFHLFSAFLKSLGQDARAPADRPLPPAFQCPRSGFHGFQCWHPSRDPATPLFPFVLSCKSLPPAGNAVNTGLKLFSKHFQARNFAPLSSPRFPSRPLRLWVNLHFVEPERAGHFVLAHDVHFVNGHFGCRECYVPRACQCPGHS